MYCIWSNYLFQMFLKPVLCESAGQYYDAFKVAQEYLAMSKERPSLFLCAPRVFELSAHNCGLIPQTEASTLIPCQNERLQQQCPVSYFVIPGNRWTSPKHLGWSCIFLILSGSHEVRGWFFSPEWDWLQMYLAVQIDGRSQTHFVMHYIVCTATSEHYID